MTMTTKEFTSDTLDLMERHDHWLGFGYLGERRNTRVAVEEGELPESFLDRVIRVDNIALTAAEEAGLTHDELFEWANSKNGRWFADTLLGSLDDMEVNVNRDLLPGAN